MIEDFAVLGEEREKADADISRSAAKVDDAWLAALQIVETAVGIDREDLITETTRLLGFDRTGTDLRARIDEQIKALLRTERIRSECGHIRLALDDPPAVE
jgi:hypothetical protein